jgi:hypothetical protein
VEGGQDHARAELDPVGYGRQCPEKGQQGREVAVGRAMVLGHPRSVEPARLDALHELDDVAVLGMWIALAAHWQLSGEQPDPELHDGSLPGRRPLQSREGGSVRERTGNLREGRGVPLSRRSFPSLRRPRCVVD